MLRQVVRRFAALELNPVVACELEFYLVAEAVGPDGAPVLPRSFRLVGEPTEPEAFLHDRLEEQEPFLERVERWGEAQQLPLKSVLPEYAPGQFEINLAHRDDPLRAADEALMLKRLVKAAARATGQRATFMAKPFPQHAGSGLHVHVSLVDRDGRNAFAEAPDGEDRLRHALGGLAAGMAEAMLIFAPNANGYRRLRPLSYAPMAPTWGRNNRTVALRVPASGPAARRIEHRVAGADANPYLVVAAVLAGILHGLETRADPGPETTGNAYTAVPPSLPATWEAALAAFAAEVLPTCLGERFCRLYAACRQAERDRFHQHVSPLEYRWYLATV